MIPFYAAGLIVLYAVNAGANAYMQCKWDAPLPTSLFRSVDQELEWMRVTDNLNFYSGRVQGRPEKPEPESPSESTINSEQAISIVKSANRTREICITSRCG
jgi:hypothetical protein